MDDRTHDYRPIDCSFHDRIEAAATLRRTVRIVHTDEDGNALELSDRVADWFVQDGVEYLRTASGTVLRLDRMVSMEDL